jgi:hypothetical protein
VTACTPTRSIRIVLIRVMITAANNQHAAPLTEEDKTKLKQKLAQWPPVRLLVSPVTLVDILLCVLASLGLVGLVGH